MCREFYQEFRRLPTRKETIGEFKIGSFITNIKSGQNKHLKEQIQEIFEIEKLEPKEKTSDEQKI